MPVTSPFSPVLLWLLTVRAGGVAVESPPPGRFGMSPSAPHAPNLNSGAAADLLTALASSPCLAVRSSGAAPPLLRVSDGSACEVTLRPSTSYQGPPTDVTFDIPPSSSLAINAMRSLLLMRARAIVRGGLAFNISDVVAQMSTPVPFLTTIGPSNPSRLSPLPPPRRRNLHPRQRRCNFSRSRPERNRRSARRRARRRRHRPRDGLLV
jgi:hypothetical protein